jgi:hypothetical protein
MRHGPQRPVLTPVMGVKRPVQTHPVLWQFIRTRESSGHGDFSLAVCGFGFNLAPLLFSRPSRQCRHGPFGGIDSRALVKRCCLAGVLSFGCTRSPCLCAGSVDTLWFYTSPFFKTPGLQCVFQRVYAPGRDREKAARPPDRAGRCRVGGGRRPCPAWAGPLSDALTPRSFPERLRGRS